MKSYCLASSSQGNCYILEFEIKGVPTRIMVECGIPLSNIYKGLNQYGFDLSSIETCLITHAHSDHSKAAIDLKRLGIKIFASPATLKAIHVDGEELIEEHVKMVCEGVYVLPFAVEHDCEGSLGFVIKTHEETVIFVNDHKRWKTNLINFKPNYVFIECNYDHKVVYAQYNNLKKRLQEPLSRDEYDEVKLKIAQHERNLNSHCSLHGTLVGLSKLNLSKCKAIFLMHLSDRYANEYRMKNEVQYKTQIITYVCGKIGGVK